MTKKFDLERYKSKFPNSRYEAYNYEKYRAINPHLTEETYRHLYQCKAVWKIVCGKEVYTHFGVKILDAVWYLDTPYNNDRKYLHGYDGYEW